MMSFFVEYAKHSTLNLGQALQGLRYVHSHPDVDRIAPRGSARHLRLSLALRGKRVVNDLFFAAIPPHWHHTPEEVRSFHGVTFKRWFQYGYCAWRFSETGEKKTLMGDEDPRWDPRCQ
jgi:hypothetical protein